mmetsp:Transcript_25635/g.69566  ORF Transcript_25635/g.69566 Transcript_25635/m.69566 type:complete len:87 (+) Transcript_25635:3974-4234(+)
MVPGRSQGWRSVSQTSSTPSMPTMKPSNSKYYGMPDCQQHHPRQGPPTPPVLQASMTPKSLHAHPQALNRGKGNSRPTLIPPLPIF